MSDKEHTTVTIWSRLYVSPAPVYEGVLWRNIKRYEFLWKSKMPLSNNKITALWYSCHGFFTPRIMSFLMNTVNPPLAFSYLLRFFDTEWKQIYPGNKSLYSPQVHAHVPHRLTILNSSSALAFITVRIFLRPFSFQFVNDMVFSLLNNMETFRFIVENYTFVRIINSWFKHLNKVKINRYSVNKAGKTLYIMN